MRRLPYLLATLALLAGIALLPSRLLSRPQASSDFVHFESGHVHPMAMTPDGTRLLVVNTPDATLSIFDLTGTVPRRIASVPVGLEPISVAARSDHEAWVVSTLSDAVEIVDLDLLQVRATLHTGDEPADVVFAGSPERAFVSVGGEDVVKVFDPSNLAIAPIAVAIPGRQPRALARTADGSRVYVAVFAAGNRTTALSETEAGDSLPPPNPPMSGSLPPGPRTGLIVAQNAQGDWRDGANHLWNSKVRYSLTEVDVVGIDANTRAITRTIGDLAANNLGLAVDAATGVVATTGQEARNAVRLEPNLRGHTVDARLSLIPTSGAATIVNLDPHIDYSVSPGPPSEADSAIGMPTGVAWMPNGQQLLVSSMATHKLALSSSSGTLRARIPVVQGPTGVLADPVRLRVYVLGRFRGELQMLHRNSFASLSITRLGFDPTPDDIVNGRRWFYSGRTSGHGDQSCASCHLFGDMDQLAWDLGDPQGAFLPPPLGQSDQFLIGFHPMKGPMVTQTLRGMRPQFLHWRGERADLDAFRGTFVTLLGRGSALADSEFAAFTAFATALRFPPNPNRLLDNTLSDAPVGQPSARRGEQTFLNVPIDGSLRCALCHSNADGASNAFVSGFAMQTTQDMRIPHLRNLYAKTGFVDTAGAVSKRGFGYTHDGSVRDLFTFLHLPQFFFAGGTVVADQSRRDVESFLLSFPTGTAPAVGASMTLDSLTRNAPAMVARMDTLQAEATGGRCDLIAKGRVNGVPRGWQYLGAGSWRADRTGEPDLSSSALRALAGTGRELFVMGVPVGSGLRMARDHDRDGIFDGDERAAGSDPYDPASTPANVAVGPGRSIGIGLRGARPNPFVGTTGLEFALAEAAGVELVIHDVLGREVRVLARDEHLEAGPHSLEWDGRRGDGNPAGPGVYFARLRSGGQEWTRAVVKLR